jgi:thioredoxin-related protein
MPALHRLLPLAVVFSWFAATGAAGDVLPAAVNLQEDGRQAAAGGLPVVVFFRSASCPFCREVEELYLQPLLRDSAAAPRFVLRAVDIDQSRALIGFDGARTDHGRFARQQGVRLVPHLRFVGSHGEPLAEDLVGISSHDFYGGYLEDAINAARDRLRR